MCQSQTAQNRADLARGRHDVHVRVTVAAVVHAEVGAHAAADELALGPGSGELPLVVAGELSRQGGVELAGELGVRAALGLLDRVPELGAVAVELGRVARQQHLAAHDALLARVVVLDAGAPVEDTLGGAVGCGGGRGAPGAAPDDLGAEVVVRHASRPLPNGRRLRVCGKGESPRSGKPVKGFSAETQGAAAQLSD